jgi:UDP-N-acetylmuramyl pentapeptide phosphotransferase/UDP-N-acetylglucosamine-1-phosphate transferase
MIGQVDDPHFWTIDALLIVVGALALTAGLIIMLRPWLRRYALARPNARSLHHNPTPQGGGMAVVAATVLVAGAAILAGPELVAQSGARLLVVIGATAVLAVTGALDDVFALGPAPRLVLQVLAVGCTVATLPADAAVLPFLPLWADRVAVIVAGVWFVNLVNFMDGIDWMTVAEVVPVTAGLTLVGAAGALPSAPIIFSLALLGAILGFAPFNRPVAKLFLGDVGSLPIGLLLGWLLLVLAGRGFLTAAVLLPLYYLTDATITLVWRLFRGERVWEAHRSHFYQRAAARGFTVPQIVARVFVVNAGLAALALASVVKPGLATSLAALGLGGTIVGWLLFAFSRGRP